MPTKVQKEYYTAEEVRIMLRFSTIDTIYRYIRCGKLKAYRPSGSVSSPWRIKPSDLEKFMESNKKE